MRIASLLYWDLARNDGVARKAFTQARLWQEAGHEHAGVSIRPGHRREDTSRAIEAVEAAHTGR